MIIKERIEYPIYPKFDRKVDYNNRLKTIVHKTLLKIEKNWYDNIHSLYSQ